MDPHVIVTIAPNGVIHAWGDGPVVGGKVNPFPDLLTARKALRRMKREERERGDDPDDGTIWRVCKMLGIESVPVEVVAG